MKLFVISLFVWCSIFNQFDFVCCQCYPAVYCELLEQLDNKLSEESDLVSKLEPLFSLPREGHENLRGGVILSTWVESFKKAVTISYIHAEDMCKKRVSTVANNNLCDRLCAVLTAYKEDIVKIGRYYYDIQLVYSVEPRYYDIEGFESALNEFKRKKFERESEINNQLESMKTTYHQLVNEVNAKIDQSVIVQRQYLLQVKLFKKELETLFLQTKKIDGEKLYDTAQLDALNTALIALRGKQLELATCLQKLLSDIQAYNDQRINWAGILLDTTLPPRPSNKLGVMDI
ncbi:uncharacterized protein LOC116340827 [Contarinia nasturtii]|uniref:uncharacterized protein LOC116340827 n=1 Tax=Contarinia nasturtii TaxID=265458 RepID=UPI0012D49A9F|nr:uncharacterized protein LOC116340827 [Contarinia nasturtii]